MRGLKFLEFKGLVSKLQSWDLNQGCLALSSSQHTMKSSGKSEEEKKGHAHSVLRRNPKMQRGAGISLPTQEKTQFLLCVDTKHWAWQYRMLWNLMCEATSYKGIFILYIDPNLSAYNKLLNCVEQAEIWWCSISKSIFLNPHEQQKILALI